jgi:mono/diheme cytochrome c family protein
MAKVILGTLFFLSGLGATFTMMTLMGKAEKRTSPDTLRKLHKFFGFIFFLLLFVLAFMGLRHWASAGDNIPFRAVLHAVLALALIIVLVTKVTIIQFFKQFLKMAPTMGLMVFSLSFIVFAISGGYYVMRSLYSSAPAEITEAGTVERTQSSVAEGKKIYDRLCLTCHSADSEEIKIGPSLLGVLKKDSLPHTSKPATKENIKQQLIRPALTMPAFKNFSDKELGQLFAYLETL